MSISVGLCVTSSFHIVVVGFKNAADFSKNRQNSTGSVRTEFKNHRFLEFKFNFFEKNKNMEKIM
jgi:hypothetical protein